jgi:hypothetical protein
MLSSASLPPLLRVSFFFFLSFFFSLQTGWMPPVIAAAFHGTTDIVFLLNSARLISLKKENSANTKN